MGNPTNPIIGYLSDGSGAPQPRCGFYGIIRIFDKIASVMKSAALSAKPAWREWYLDNLKVFLTVLVIFHHAGQAYSGSDRWVYQPSLDECAVWLRNFFAVNASFFMGLYFLISGYFVPSSYDRHGFRGFVSVKLLHLGLPLAVFTVLCSAATGHVEVGHLWFVEHLLFYSLLYALFRLAVHKPLCVGSRLSLAWMVSAVVLVSAANHLIRPLWPINDWKFLGGFLWAEPAHLPQYAVLFVMGMMAFRGDWFRRMPRNMGRALFGLGLLLASAVYLRPLVPFLQARIDTSWWWYESLLCIFLSFGLVALFRFRFDKTSPVMRWLAAQSYAAYLIHIFVIVGLQHLFDRVPMGGGTGKFLFIAIAGTAVTYGAAYLLRRIPGVGRVV